MYISVVTLTVSDVDRAIGFYVDTLGWEKTMDVPMGEDTRWVTVQPKGGQASFTLTKSGATRAEEKVIGFSGVIIEVDDVYKAGEQLKNAGVVFLEGPRTEPWGGWAMFQDSEGNIHGLHSPVPATV